MSQPAKPLHTMTLTEVRAEKERLQTVLEIANLQRLQRVTESFSYGDGWGSMVDPRESLAGDPDYRPFFNSQTLPTDRSHGRDFPLWINLQQLATYRRRSRTIASTNAHAIGLLRNLTNYLIGDGFKYKIAPKKEVLDANPDQPGKQIPEKVQRWVREYQRVVDRFTGVADRTGLTPWARREREAYRRVRRDGEAFIRLHVVGHTVTPRFVEPECCIDPPWASDVAGWSHGIKHRTDPFEDIESRVAYYFCYTADPGMGDEVPASRVIHILPPDHDSTVKRGMPFFSFDVADAFDRARKLQRNLSEGAALQAAIAWIEQYESATKGDVQRFADDKADVTRSDPFTGRTVQSEKWEPGTIPRIPKGKTFVGAPVNPNGAAHQAIYQGDLRQAVSAACAPESLTGDTGSMNYAAIKEAGVPFQKNAETEQAHYRDPFAQAVWFAVLVAVEAGELDREALQYVELQVEAPNVLVRDPLEQAQTDQILIGLKVKSPQQGSMERGYDPEQVAANFAEMAERDGPPMPGLPGPGEEGANGGPGPAQPDPGQQADAPPEEEAAPGPVTGVDSLGRKRRIKTPGGPALESRLLTEGDWDEDKHPRANDGKFGSGGGGGANHVERMQAHNAEYGAAQQELEKHLTDRSPEGRAKLQAAKSKIAALDHEAQALFHRLDTPAIPAGNDAWKPLDAAKSHWISKGGLVRTADKLKPTFHGLDPSAPDFEQKLGAVHDAARQELAALPAGADALSAHPLAKSPKKLGIVLDRAGTPDGETGTGEPYWQLPGGAVAVLKLNGLGKIVPGKAARAAGLTAPKITELPSDYDEMKTVVGNKDTLARMVQDVEPATLNTKSQSYDMWELPGGHAAVAQAGTVDGTASDAEYIQLWPKEKVAKLKAAAAKAANVTESAKDADLGDPAERATLIADILAHTHGDDALAAFDDSDVEESLSGLRRRGYTLLESVSLLEAWDHLKHPRGKGGRFIPKGSAEAVSTAKDRVKAALKGGKSAGSAKELADHLSILTVKQLHELKKEYGIAAGGRTADELREKIAARLDTGRRGDAAKPAGGSGDLKGTKVVDDSGKPLVVHHGTYADFGDFKKTEDLGYHFGTEDQASQRLEDTKQAGKTGRVIRAHLDIKNPVDMPDMFGSENPADFKDFLEEKGWMTPENQEAFDRHKQTMREMGAVMQTSPKPGTPEFVAKQDKLKELGRRAVKEESAFYATVRETLQARGYDGIRYKNEFEGEGDSFIAFDNSQIKQTNGAQPTTPPPPADYPSYADWAKGERAIFPDEPE